MKSKSKDETVQEFDVASLMGELWDVDEKIRAIAILFENFHPVSIVEHSGRLAGVGVILSETSEVLRKTIEKLDVPGLELRKEK